MLLIVHVQGSFHLIMKCSWLTAPHISVNAQAGAIWGSALQSCQSAPLGRNHHHLADHPFSKIFPAGPARKLFWVSAQSSCSSSSCRWMDHGAAGLHLVHCCTTQGANNKWKDHLDGQLSSSHPALDRTDYQAPPWQAEVFKNSKIQKFKCSKRYSSLNRQISLPQHRFWPVVSVALTILVMFYIKMD